ncbi:hypothetical protein [Halorubrum ezzemoulense]|uniref:hypothetical protein n=1 Tax=Halorubrum ezzemoulense TaxID=337243 RepID=UPI00232E6D42|nr:hypothetical protein [Halorubrum ezzemoulense]MDB9233343.1 hypothetical protein [Halorubrum ezzemoulense]
MDDDFPSGTTLVEALVELYRETDDEDVVELIEAEIATEGFGLVPVAVPDETPAPDASVETLVDLHETFAQRDKGVGRYIRLRVFDALGAFEETPVDRDDADDDGDVMAGLSDDDLRYLAALDEPELQMLTESELTHRGLD